MRLHFLVEGPAEEAFLKAWLPRFLPARHSYKIIPHRGKGKIPRDPTLKPDPKRQGLLDQLPAKLRAFGRSFTPDTDRFIVLVDLDRDDCKELKQRMCALLDYCEPHPTVLFRIAIEETEAFYLGERKAIKQAFPHAKLYKLDNYIQDSVCGTWELFQSVIGAESEDKVFWARQMGAHLNTQGKGAPANQSLSFQHFCKAILRLAGEALGDEL